MNIECRQIFINNSEIEFVFLEQISDVKSGLTTGDNKFYVYKKNSVQGPYKIVNKDLILNDNELSKIREEEET